MVEFFKWWSYTNIFSKGKIKSVKRGLTLDEINFPERYGKVVGEVGYFVIDQNSDLDFILKVKFRNIYRNPVVIPYVATFLGSDPTTVRVVEVGKNYAKFRMIDANLTEHTVEICCYLVVEQGRWTLDGGVVVEAGVHETSSVHRSGQDFDGDWVSFSEPFSSTPVVLHALQTNNNDSFMETHVHGVTTDGFYCQQEAGGTGVSATTEKIGWVALSTGKGTTSGFAYEIDYGSDGSNDGVEDTPHKISFTSFNKRPIVIVKGQSGNGIDGYWARGRCFRYDFAEVYAEEDTVGDTEQTHTDEVFGWFAIEEGALLIATS